MDRIDYKKFKKEMESRGHKVHKKGDKIIINPNNNYLGYGRGFQYATQVIEGYENSLKLINIEHFNTVIYSVKFKIIE